MKGPLARHKFPIRRLWECPHCHRRAYSSGAVAARICGECPPATEGVPWMNLVEEGRRGKGLGSKPGAMADDSILDSNSPR